MAKLVNLRLQEAQVERLGRAARKIGRTPAETAALLLEEALRQTEFSLLEFRDSGAGRQAYLKGSRLTFWQIVDFANAFDGNLERTADRLEIPPEAVQAALAYAQAFPDEIESAIRSNNKSPEELRLLFPGLEVLRID